MTRQELINNIRKKRSFLCVGLDPDIEKISDCVKEGPNPIFNFNRNIIDATAEFVVAYKPNLAFYEAYGLKGLSDFYLTIDYLKKTYPDIFIIADAKRGDIGNTARMYARSFFEETNVDAVTVAPYMGYDSVMPFLDFKNKWTILLALTSNPGNADFQLLRDESGNRFFEEVIEKSMKWGTEDNLMYVVGATMPEYLARIRKLAPNNFLLIPGVGAQGGQLDEVVKFGMNCDCGLLINSSRAILYASNDENYKNAAHEEAKKMAKQMERLLHEYQIL